MDWPLTGVLAGITILTAGASYGVVTLILSDVAVPKQTVKSAQLVPTTALPRYFTPSLPREELTPTAPPLLLNDPVGPFDIRKTNLETGPAPTEIAPTAKARLPNVVKTSPPPPVKALHQLCRSRMHPYRLALCRVRLHRQSSLKRNGASSRRKTRLISISAGI